jgi:hypothetical protein
MPVSAVPTLFPPSVVGSLLVQLYEFSGLQSPIRHSTRPFANSLFEEFGELARLVFNLLPSNESEEREKTKETQNWIKHLRLARVAGFSQNPLNS